MINVAHHAMYAAITLSRRLRRRPRAHYTRVVELDGRSDMPKALHPRQIYQLGHPGKWVILACPCGRGHLIELNLAHPGRSRWRLVTDNDQNPTLSPSVDVKDTRRCHFWLREGRVTWV